MEVDPLKECERLLEINETEPSVIISVFKQIPVGNKPSPEYQKLLSRAVRVLIDKGWSLKSLTDLMLLPSNRTRNHYEVFYKSIKKIWCEEGNNFCGLMARETCIKFLIIIISKLHSLLEGFITIQKGPDIAHTEKKLRGKLMELTAFFRAAISPVTRRELFLTAFSLDPSPEMYEFVRTEASLFYGTYAIELVKDYEMIRKEEAVTSSDEDDLPYKEVHIYLAPREVFYVENQDLTVELREDLVSAIGAFREPKLSFLEDWHVLSRRCIILMLSRSKRRQPTPLKHLERDWSAGIRIIPDEEFYEPGYVPNAIQQKKSKSSKRKTKKNGKGTKRRHRTESSEGLLIIKSEDDVINGNSKVLCRFK